MMVAPGVIVRVTVTTLRIRAGRRTVRVTTFFLT
jgi:hypothetical protein